MHTQLKIKLNVCWWPTGEFKAEAQEVGRVNIRDTISQKSVGCWHHYFEGWEYGECSNCIDVCIRIYRSARELQNPGNSSSSNHRPVKSLWHSSSMPVERKLFYCMTIIEVHACETDSSWIFKVDTYIKNTYLIWLWIMCTLLDHNK